MGIGRQEYRTYTGLASRWEVDTWPGCYDEGWRGVIGPASFAHPAKFARGLIRKIYEHARETGWLPPGSVVVDPFGGVALGGLDAMLASCSWIGCELEPKFVTLGQANICRWTDRYKHWPGLGTAQLYQGDSRELATILSGAGIVVSSPPFSESLAQAHGGGCLDDKNAEKYPNIGVMKWKHKQEDYGTSPGNLGNLSATEASFRIAISSPPYESSTQVNNNPDDMTAGKAEWKDGTDSAARVKQDYADYASTPGNLGAMRSSKQVPPLVVSSPPWEESLAGQEEFDRKRAEQVGSGRYGRKSFNGTQKDYGDTAGQLGQDSGEDFWTAASLIVQQVTTVLPPGAHAIWVLKGYVRKGVLVDFPGQWRQLCNAYGLATIHEHRALLTKSHGEQIRLDGGTDKVVTERKSFFRRLAESKGSSRIDHETVLCMVRT
jgi:hypothetical protein